MRPNQINEVMNLAARAREKGFKWNPLFVGPPGVGKSEIVQQWCKENNYEFIDFRAAYRESVDLTGYPQPQNVTDENGHTRQITRYFTPEFLPTDGKGVFFLDEVNRGTTSVMNTFMQILTDRRIDKYELPQGWIIAGAINPENEMYDVNTMDSALRDRFEIFEVNYDKKTFMNYMKQMNWDERIQMFIDSGVWHYCKPEDVGSVAGNKYLSPRTFSKLNAALKSEVPKSIEVDVYESILGKNTGRAFFQFVTDDAPVLYKDLVENKKKAFAKLESFCKDEKNYKVGHIAITIKDIVDRDEISDDLLAELALVIPADAAMSLISELEFKRKDNTILGRMKKYKHVQKHLQDVLNR